MFAKKLSPTGREDENHAERQDEQSRKLGFSDESNEMR